MMGATPAYSTIRNGRGPAGRLFSDEENRAAAPVCLLGQTVVNNLFNPGENPVGTTVRIKNFPVRVIGVLSVKGQSNFGQDQDDVVLMPFATAERKVLGVAAVTAVVSTVTGNASSNPVLK